MNRSLMYKYMFNITGKDTVCFNMGLGLMETITFSVVSVEPEDFIKQVDIILAKVSVHEIDTGVEVPQRAISVYADLAVVLHELPKHINSLHKLARMSFNECNQVYLGLSNERVSINAPELMLTLSEDDYHKVELSVAILPNKE